MAAKQQNDNHGRPLVVHVITRLDMGGSAQNTLQSCIGTAHAYRVVLIHGLTRESLMTRDEVARVNEQMERARRHGVRCITVSTLVRRISPLADLAAFCHLVWLFLRLRPDIVHTHTSKAGILGRLAAWLTRVPAIVHTPHGHVFYGHFGRGPARFFLALERLFARITDYQVALTKGEADDYRLLGVGDPTRTVLIHSGVDLDRYRCSQRAAQQRRAALGLQPPLVGTVGWLLPIKNPLLLLEAMVKVWRRYPQVGLVYVGKGELADAIRQRAEQLGVSDKVHLLGWRPDVHLLMGMLDCFVLPSRNEGMGRVLVEAMAAGVPVVATRVGGIPDLVEDGRTGLLVDSGDVHGMAAAIERVLADPALATRLRDNGLRHCRAYGREAMITALERLYGRVLAEAGYPGAPVVADEVDGCSTAVG